MRKLSSDGLVPFCSSASFFSLPDSAIYDQTCAIMNDIQHLKFLQCTHTRSRSDYDLFKKTISVLVSVM